MGDATSIAMLALAAHVALDHWRTMRKIEREKSVAPRPSLIALACEAIRERERWLPRDTHLICEQTMTVRQRGDLFTVVVRRAEKVLEGEG